MKKISLFVSIAVIWAAILSFGICAHASTADVQISYSPQDKAFTFASDSYASARVYAVAYSDGKIQKITSKSMSLNPKATKLSISTFDLSGCDTIRAFAFASSGNLRPCAKSLTLPVDALKTLYVKKGAITQSDGTEVLLKGVNFGGWLLQETWMCPVMPYGTVTSNGVNVDWAHLDTLNLLESKLGKTDAAAIMQQYYDNYITEQDFKNVANMGFNCVRIPFWYRNFMSDEDGTYITASDDDNPGFKKLDWAVQMAKKYNLYLIFDMHGCPGGQSGDHSTGKSGRNLLYYQTKYQDIMEDLWVRIADRYKYEPCIAAYDIMNEPFNNCDYNHGVAAAYRGSAWSDDTKALVNGVYDRIIKAIRKVDCLHPITVEGIWRLTRLPKAVDMGWDNMIYQLHTYDSDQSTVSSLATSLKNARTYDNVGAYVGEFNPQVYYSDSVTEFKSRGVSYTLWNYKTERFSGVPSDWGLYYRDLGSYGYQMLSEAGLTSSEMNTVYSGNLNGLSASAIKKFYKTAWTSKYLATSNFTQNSTMASYINK